MKVELKNVKYAAFASHETACFQATLYVDGAPFAIISNEGYGGSDSISPVKRGNADQFWEQVQKVDLYMKTLVTSEQQANFKYGAPYLEIWVAEQLDNFLLRKEMKRLLKSNIVIVKTDGMYTVKVPKGHTVSDGVALFSTKYPSSSILNTMPEDKAFEIFSAQAEKVGGV
jgi:hypothetical protein